MDLWCASFFFCVLVDIVAFGVSNPGAKVGVGVGLGVRGATAGVAMGGVVRLLGGAGAELERCMGGSPFSCISVR